MKTNKPFYQRVSFYLAAAGLLLAIIALSLYACNCKSEFNGGKASSTVIGWDVVAVVCLAIAVAGEVAETFFSSDNLIGKICSYLRLLKYVAFISLLVAFFFQIVEERLLIGDMLAPMLRQTASTLDKGVSASYLTSLVFTLVAMLVVIVSSVITGASLTKANEPFYKRDSFYVAAACLLLAIIAVSLYACNCKSEFNAGKASSAVVGWDVVAVLSLAFAVGGEVAETFFSSDKLIGKICSYLRFLKYFAFISLLVAFFMQILDEYSLLGTILYPIVSGTVGDPVDDALISSYFTSLVFTLGTTVFAIVSALLHKKAAFVTLKKEGAVL